MKDSKSENRNPKETRNPKLERPEHDTAPRQEAESWTWADEADGPIVLKEDVQAASPPPRDLEERTAKFGEAIIRFAKRIPQNPVNNRLIAQLVGAGTSVGANFCEANDAVSRRDSQKSIGTCRKESKESIFFLRMVATTEPSLTKEARVLWCEGKELNLIFGSIWRKGR